MEVRCGSGSQQQPEFRVAQGDLGKVIGKQGRTARSIRTILNAHATKIRKRAVLEIVE
jgi:uncharacterized protein